MPYFGVARARRDGTRSSGSRAITTGGSTTSWSRLTRPQRRPASPEASCPPPSRILVLPWNNERSARLAALRATRRSGHGNHGAGHAQLGRYGSGRLVSSSSPENFAHSYGVVLVFDEVITGFRVALGGAVERYSVVPDLATYGKAIAGGWPVAALAGRAEYIGSVGGWPCEPFRYVQRVDNGLRSR